MLNMKVYIFLVFIVLGGKKKQPEGRKHGNDIFPSVGSPSPRAISCDMRDNMISVVFTHSSGVTYCDIYHSGLISWDMRDNMISLEVAHSYISHSQPIFSILYILASTCHNLNFNIFLNLVCTANCKQEFVIKSPKNIWLEAVGEISGEGKLMRRLHRCQTSDPHC